jgi:hypothetical protein
MTFSESQERRSEKLTVCTVRWGKTDYSNVLTLNYVKLTLPDAEANPRYLVYYKIANIYTGSPPPAFQSWHGVLDFGLFCRVGKHTSQAVNRLLLSCCNLRWVGLVFGRNLLCPRNALSATVTLNLSEKKLCLGAVFISCHHR